MDEGHSRAKYMRIMRNVANRKTTQVIIDLKDLQQVSNPTTCLPA